jgi:disulfide oxidoreductase YuzD
MDDKKKNRPAPMPMSREDYGRGLKAALERQYPGRRFSVRWVDRDDGTDIS